MLPLTCSHIIHMILAMIFFFAMFWLKVVTFMQILSALNMVSPATLFLDWGSILKRFQVRNAAA
jgi:hypothetical protein